MATRTIAGRYVLGAEIGAGGSGTVWRATDAARGGDVAVKVLRPLSTGAMARVRREVLAMQVLQIPGVARLLDHGEEDGELFLVQEIVAGEPFPGAFGGSWARLGPVAVALLGTLARMHAAGIVHRDLKPANLLVDEEGRPTVLDFGLARGEPLGGTITRSDAVLGTPRWQAPEQMIGGAVDARADLYAVGVMLYEALAGRPPHPVGTLHELTLARLTRAAPPLAGFAPDVPRPVAAAIDRLLARYVEERFPTAADAAAALSGAAPKDAGLPWLGDPTLAEHAVVELLAGRGVDVRGERGAGRSRLARRVADGLEAAGRRVVTLASAERPYASLRPLVGELATAVEVSQVEAFVAERLAEAQAAGVVALADDAERLDRWSLRALGAFPTLRTWAQGPSGAWPLAPLSEADLRPLFGGPDRLLHLREDGARELHARTAGVPARVSSEVAGWVAAGLARWRGGRVVVDRAALERLAAGLRLEPGGAAAGSEPLSGALQDLLAWVALAWPHGTRALLGEVAGLATWEVEAELHELERIDAVRTLPDGRVRPRRVAAALQEWPAERRRQAHAAIAAALPEGATGRLAHLVGAGLMSAAGREAGVVGRRLAREGFLGAALATLAQGLGAARDAGDAELEAALVEETVHAALSEYTVPAMESALYEVQRSRAPAREPLARLLRAAVARERGELAALGALVDGLAFADEALDGWVQSLRAFLAVRRGDLEPLAEAEAWAARRGTPFARGRVAGWRALWRYQQGRFEESAEDAVAALEGREDTVGAIGARLNAANALLEVARYPEALRHARAASAKAAVLRLPWFEAQAEWACRSIRYRSGEDMTPDLELVEAACALGMPRAEAPILTTEAAIAWRAGWSEEAHRLAARATQVWSAAGHGVAALITRALAVATSHQADEGEARAVSQDAARAPPWATVQVWGLVGERFPALARERSGAAEQLLSLLPPSSRRHRRDVLSPEEACSRIRSRQE